MTRKIIGEGSYGCVHKPSIHCKNIPKPGFDYNNYVSKIMKTKNAKKELAEFLIIGNIDPANEYHLGQPILCEPNLNEVNVKNEIKQCKHINLDDIEANPNEYSLLLQKFGGLDLKVLCGDYLKKYLDKDKTERTDKFWFEVHHLIKGLQFFKDNGIVHNDIKPQNILFDTTNGKMKYIDFGLMRKKKDIITSSKNNKNYLAIYHWSYPFDCAFMNKQQFEKYIYSDNKKQFKNTLSDLIIYDSEKNPLDLPIKKPSSFKILFTYLNPQNTVPNSSVQHKYIDSFFDGFNQMISTNNYDTVLNNIVDSIDVFCLGFTLQYIANCFKRLNALSSEEFKQLSSFFHKMYDFNPSTRVININTLLHDYENVLRESGILERLNKYKDLKDIKFVSNDVDIIPSDTNTVSSDKPTIIITNDNLTNDNLTNKKATVIVCPENKELNPRTNRCVKKCKQGYLRNEQFKCYSVARKTQQNNKNNNMKSKTIKLCPENKELNPRTNRCVKKCKQGYLRNDQFKCYNAERRVKTVKHLLVQRGSKGKIRTRNKNRTKGRN